MHSGNTIESEIPLEGLLSVEDVGVGPAGASGILREQEAELFKLRTEVEGEVQMALPSPRPCIVVSLRDEASTLLVGP